MRSFFIESHKFWGALALAVPLLVLMGVVFVPLIKKMDPQWGKKMKHLFYGMVMAIGLSVVMALIPMVICVLYDVPFFKMALISFLALIISTSFIIGNYSGIRSLFHQWLKSEQK